MGEGKMSEDRSTFTVDGQVTDAEIALSSAMIGQPVETDNGEMIARPDRRTDDFIG
jgi:hypothetical protein